MDKDGISWTPVDADVIIYAFKTKDTNTIIMSFSAWILYGW